MERVGRYWARAVRGTVAVLGAWVVLAALGGADPAWAQDSPPQPGAAAEAGVDIAELQRLLNRQGYDAGTVDGLIGPRTRGAIRAYQRAQGLPVTGEPSPSLLAVLQGAPTAPGAADAPPSAEIPAETGPEADRPLQELARDLLRRLQTGNSETRQP